MPGLCLSMKSQQSRGLHFWQGIPIPSHFVMRVVRGSKKRSLLLLLLGEPHTSLLADHYRTSPPCPLPWLVNVPLLTRSGAHRTRCDSSPFLRYHSRFFNDCYMLASLRRSRSTLLYQATPLLSPSSFAPSSSVRFLRTPRHTRSAAARARTLNGDGDGVSGSSFGQPREEEGSGLKRIRGLNPREVSQLSVPFSR